MLRYIAHFTIETIDRILEATAPRLPGVAGAGLFWLGGDGYASFWDVWTDKDSMGNRSTVVRMGRLEFGIDWK